MGNGKHKIVLLPGEADAPYNGRIYYYSSYENDEHKCRPLAEVLLSAQGELMMEPFHFRIVNDGLLEAVNPASERHYFLCINVATLLLQEEFPKNERGNDVDEQEEVYGIEEAHWS
jgi:hypothetical protein